MSFNNLQFENDEELIPISKHPQKSKVPSRSRKNKRRYNQRAREIMGNTTNDTVNTNLRRSTRVKQQNDQDVPCADIDIDTKEDDSQDKEFDVNKLKVEEWATTSDCTHKISLTMRSTRAEMLKVLDFESIDLKKLVKEHNVWMKSINGKVIGNVTKPKKADLLKLFHLNVCKGCAKADNPTIPCSQCDSYWIYNLLKIMMRFVKCCFVQNDNEYVLWF